MKNKQNNTFLKIFNKLYAHFGPQYWWPANSRFEVIVGAILTQNTSWMNVEKAISNLRKNRILTVKKLHYANTEKLAELIRSSGYFNQKAKRLKNFTTFLLSEYNGSLSKMLRTEQNELRKKLLAINGLGEETVDSILLYAADKAVFVVDAYTKRVFSRCGLISCKETYGQIQSKFMENLSKDKGLFNEYHALIVALGKDICRKKKPKCEVCPLSKGSKHNKRVMPCR